MRCRLGKQAKYTVNRMLIAGLIALLLSACAAGPDVDQRNYIELSVMQPLPAPAATAIVPLRVSVAAVISPRGTVESYQPLLDYLSKAIGRPVELVQRRTYEETNRLIEAGEVDFAFVCTSAYIAGHEAFNMQLLVAPEVNGRATYQSFLIVPAESSAQTMEDLRGTVFAFTDPMSHTGRVYPTYLVQQLGSTPQTFFARTFFTYNHDDAIRAVASGVADGAAVDSLVFHYAVAREPELAERVRIIHESPEFGVPPVVVSPTQRPQLRAQLEEILLNMHRTPAGREALASLGVDDFVIIDDSAYDTVRILTRAVGPLLP
ncbi:MAG: phosphate/phosphite/phosphonate ABC transporter substrate-binding protein [Aggregatilineales bacterium]